MHGLLALITREQDRQAIRAALPSTAAVQFVDRSDELHPPWRNGAPTAIVAELRGGARSELEHALEALRRTAPTVPVWAFMPIHGNAIRELMQLSARGLVVEVISSDEDIRARLRVLLREAYAHSETAAIRRVWHRWMGPETRDILAVCIDASVGAATIEDIASALDKSPRTLERTMLHLELPSAHHVVGSCRLLRAIHRLQNPEASVKMVATELGYSSSRSLATHLRRQSGLTISDLRTGRGFDRLAALIQAELLTIRAHGRVPPHGDPRGRPRRKVDPR